MTPLARILAGQIAATGPMTVADYMTACLLHPVHGYYTTRDPLGCGGDFTTAPEISQMWGELVGLAVAQDWVERGRPAPFALVELGPGRGTAMADALRAAGRVPGFSDAATLHLVEASPVLRAVQAATLSAHAPTLHDTVDSLPGLPLLGFANEFFDALPIRQFLRDGDHWCERLVGVADGVLAFGLGGPALPPTLAPRLGDTADGDMVEICAPAAAIAGALGRHIAAHGGCLRIVDYGSPQSLGDTLQALRGHGKVGVLDAPGDSDLTAHVDFGALAAASPCAASALVPQGVWLERLGIAVRARALARGLGGAELDSHVAAHRRLTHPEEMGLLFRVMALHDGTRPLPDLAASDDMPHAPL